MAYFAYDNCRCLGIECDRKYTCLRHVAMSDMGPRTPVAKHFCEELGGEQGGYIHHGESESYAIPQR